MAGRLLRTYTQTHMDVRWETETNYFISVCIFHHTERLVFHMCTAALCAECLLSSMIEVHRGKRFCIYSISLASCPSCWFFLVFYVFKCNDIFWSFLPCVYLLLLKICCACGTLYLCAWRLPEGMFAQHGVPIHCGVFVVWGTGGRREKVVDKMPSLPALTHQQNHILIHTNVHTRVWGENELV